MWRSLILFLLIHSAALAAPNGKANQQFFKFTDEKGTIVFVDSISKVPAEFRDRVETLAGIAARSESKSTTFVFRRNAKIVVVNALLNDKVPARMMIDTSAKQSAIIPSFALRLGVNPKDPTLKTIEVTKSDGLQVRMPLMKLENVNLQGRVAQNLYVLIDEKAGTSDYNGVLGSDFLDYFRVNLDFQKGSLVLEDKDRAEIEQVQ